MGLTSSHPLSPADFARDVSLSARELSSKISQDVRSVWQDERLHLALLALIVLAGIFLRIALVNRPMQDDESTTFLRFVSMPLGEALSTYTIPNNHLLNTLLVKLSVQLFGIAPWAVRLPSLIAGCALIPASYLFVRRFYNREAALLAAALVAGSAYLIDYATTSRGYSMILCGFTLMLFLAGHLVERWNTFAVLLTAVIGALSIYAIPIALYPAAVVYVWLAVSLALRWKTEGNAARWRDLVLSGLLVGLLSIALYSPILINPGQMGLVTMAQPQSWRKFGNYYEYSLPILWGLWNTNLPQAAVIALVTAFVAGLVLHWRIAQTAVPVALVAAVVVPAMVIIPRTVVPGERIWSFLLPLYLGVSAAGVVAMVHLARRFAPEKILTTVLAALSLLWIIAGWAVYLRDPANYYDDTPLHRNAERIATFLGPDVPPRSAILTMYGAFPSINYYQVVHYGLPGPDYVDWGKIQKHTAQANRMYVLILLRDGQPEQAPTDVLTLFGVNTAEYTDFQLLTTIDMVQIYAADRIAAP